jgi:hypothetical protein
MYILSCLWHDCRSSLDWLIRFICFSRIRSKLQSVSLQISENHSDTIFALQELSWNCLRYGTPLCSLDSHLIYTLAGYIILVLQVFLSLFSSLVRVKIILRLMVRWPGLVSGHHLGPLTNFSFPSTEITFRHICFFVVLGCTLWREDCSVITHMSATGPCQRCHSGSKSHRTWENR